MEKLSSPSQDQQQAVLEGLAFLSQIFWGPDPETCDTMIQRNCLQPFEILSPLMTFDPPGAIEEIAAFISEHADSISLFENLEESYVHLFISNRSGIPAPLYQSCYSDAARPGGHALLMGGAALGMKRRLESVGLSLDGDLGQMPDHLSVEIEYLYFLIQGGESGDDSYLTDQAQSFSSEVMLPWVGEFKKRLEGEEVNLFYPRMASLLISLLNLISGM